MLLPKLFDVHTHTQFAAFREDQDVVIQRALDAGVWMINVGTQRDTSKSAVETAHRYPEGVYATVGLHPIHTEKSYHDEQELGDTIPLPSSLPLEEREGGGGGGFTSRGEEFDYEYYKNLAQDPKVVGIGECGLDYYRITNYELRIRKQKEVFKRQIELAAEVKKPLMVHCRNAFSDLISILNSYFATRNSGHPGVIHFFTGTVDDARKLLDLGFSFSFGGVITFARDYDEAVRFIPLDRILLETDAPYVTPAPYRGKRNEPIYVTQVAERMAEIKGVSRDEIAGKTLRNAGALFGIIAG